MAEDASGDHDPLEGLEERLKSHAQAFESLLALTPARDYYGSQIVDGKDPSDQWNRKKQTKEERRAAKKAKLDPANQKSALDVMREREASVKRKRDDLEDEEDGDVDSGKRQKGEDDADTAEARRSEKAARRKEKRQRKKEKSAEKKAKAEIKRARRQQKELDEAQVEKEASQAVEQDEDNESGEEAEQIDLPADLEVFDVSGLADSVDENEADGAASNNSSAPTTPPGDSPAFDTATNHSASSSSSSIIPPSITDAEPHLSEEQSNTIPQRPRVNTNTSTSSSKSADVMSGTSSPRIVLPAINHEELQERVRARIEALRAARKADGPDGKPAKSRQELLDQRRKKEEQRKANKKAQRQKAKEDEQKKREEQLRGSGSPLNKLGDIFSPPPRERENNYSFSRLAFEDGTHADANLTSLQEPKKHKGPQDPRTALQAAQKKEKRISGYDAAKRDDIAEKDMWLNARKRAHGERVRDDTSLLKKALKRKEKQKGKSEREWKGREEAVVKGKEVKQKKREANLQKRKEEKGGGGKKGKGKAAAGKGPKGKKVKRAGFEGRFKA